MQKLSKKLLIQKQENYSNKKTTHGMGLTPSLLKRKDMGRKTKKNKIETSVDDMHFDTMARYHEQERERLAIMMNIIFNT